MTKEIIKQLQEWAEIYNNPKYFEEDPIAFPKKFYSELQKGTARREDVEIAAIFAAHFAWGRRAMIVRDCERLFDEMNWKPFDYVMARDYRDEDRSIHRTIKWCDVAAICTRLHDFYKKFESLENSFKCEMIAHLLRIINGIQNSCKYLVLSDVVVL